MEIDHITYQGPELDDPKLLEYVPNSLKALLTSLNGFVQFGGGLHVRGACSEPEWHSLRRAWYGPSAIHQLYPSVDQEWVPFAEDCVGDQFLLRHKDVLRLSAETGDVEAMDLTLGEFLRNVNSNPIEFLSMQPLLQFQKDRGDVPEGYLVLAYPPFCTKEAAEGVALKAVPAWELHNYHSELAKALAADGSQLYVRIVE